MNAQANIPLSEILRGSIGFDQIGSMIDQVLNSDRQAGSYPPFNIKKGEEDNYQVTLAVAGFNENDIRIEQEGNFLEISGKKEQSDDEKAPVFLHQGISNRFFTRRFQLADHVKVTGAALQDGLLIVDLMREIPDERKARNIPIKTNTT